MYVCMYVRMYVRTYVCTYVGAVTAYSRSPGWHLASRSAQLRGFRYLDALSSMLYALQLVIVSSSLHVTDTLVTS